MKLNFLKLKFQSALHIGRGLPNDYGKSETTLHSDTLKAALFVMALKLDSSWETRAEEFHNSFKISSAFPYYKEVMFLPRPHFLNTIALKGIEMMTARKTQKNIQFLSIKLFEQVINGNIEIEITNGQILDKHFAIEERKEYFGTEAIMKQEVQQRVQVEMGADNKFENKTTPFFVDRVYFSENAGFYVLLEILNDQLSDFLLACFRLLGEEGVGTDRSSGNGIFSITSSRYEEIELNVNEKPNSWMPLGLYCPDPSEKKNIEWDKSFYEIIKRGGYMGGSSNASFYRIKKNSINMTTEGSLLAIRNQPEGKIADLKPKWDAEGMHSVWRDGRPIFIPVNYEQ